MLKRGLAPQAIIHTGPTYLLGDAKAEMSFWQGLVLCIVGCSESIFDTEPPNLIGKIIENFLDRGADPQLWISITDDAKASFTPGGEANPEFGYINGLELTLGKERRKVVGAWSISVSLFQHIVDNDGIISLRDLIEFWGLENKETILQLAGRNERQIGTLENSSPGQLLRYEANSTEPKTKVPELESTLTPTLQPASEEPVEVGPEQTQDPKHFTWWLKLIEPNHAVTFLVGECDILSLCMNPKFVTSNIGVILAIVLPRIWTSVYDTWRS